jgi:hypothetical protein
MVHDVHHDVTPAPRAPADTRSWMLGAIDAYNGIADRPLVTDRSAYASGRGHGLDWKRRGLNLPAMLRSHRGDDATA